jgi:hypothetical protein
MLLPAFVALFGVVAAMFLLGFGDRPEGRSSGDGDDRGAAGMNDRTLVMAAVPGRPSSSDDDLRQYSREFAGGQGMGAGVTSRGHVDAAGEFIDDDDYAEYTVSWDDPVPQPAPAPDPETRPVAGPDDEGTEPLSVPVDHVLPAPAEVWHSAPVETWHSLLADEEQTIVQPAVRLPEPEPPAPEPEPEPAPEPQAPAPELPAVPLKPEPWRSVLDDLIAGVDTGPKESIGFAHNGFHVDDEQRFQPTAPPGRDRSPAEDPLFAQLLADYRPNGNGGNGNRDSNRDDGNDDGAARHQRSEEPAGGRTTNGRHSRDENDDAASYGRHSRPRRD